MDEETKEKIHKCRKDKWIEAWFAVEVLAVNEDVVKESLEDHITKMGREKDVFIYEKSFKEVKKVENPTKNIKEGFSYIVELKLFIKNLYALIRVAMLYGPSSIEILSPNNKEINLDEIQSISNMVSSMVHQFAAIGVGGIVIAPDKKHN